MQWTKLSDKHKDGKAYRVRFADGTEADASYMAGANLEVRDGTAPGWVAFVDYDEDGIVPCGEPAEVWEP